MNPPNQEHGHEHEARREGVAHDAEGHAVLKYSDDSDHDYDEMAHYPLMVEAMRQILIDKGLITADDLREQLELMDARTPAAGAQVVARAWTYPAFKARLLANGCDAIAEMGIPAIEAPNLIVVENTPETHNLVVCTLCSCYPRSVLGLPPEWYKSKSYRSRTVIEPRVVLAEFGTELPDSVTVRVHDSNADMRYLVLPMRPEGTEGWTEERLGELVGRDCMIGVTLPRRPAG